MATAPTRLTFATEDCASCSGQGRAPDREGRCNPCRGKGKVWVAQPSIHCPRCGGNGKPEQNGIWSADHCVVCLGTGWVRTEFHY